VLLEPAELVDILEVKLLIYLTQTWLRLGPNAKLIFVH